MSAIKTTVAKSEIKPKLLDYLRKVESDKVTITITDRGRPVAQIIPFKPDQSNKKEDPLEWFRGAVLKYDDPFEPVGLEDWELLP
ncbi:MAG: type II toxin-antitoxin system prevent-host-death family antitoxin [Deltaproteobacteria bacterium]|nr:type II toxin-antitoxin system prevent-host-death family antitoxin [Deltaproteobacteria bacterium]